MVDREPVLAREPADATAERQATQADRCHVAGRQRDSVLAGLRTEFGRASAGLSPYAAVRGVEAQTLHLAEVEDHAPVDRPETREAVAATADRQRQIALAGELDRADDGARVAIDGLVPHLPCGVVRLVLGLDHLAQQPRLKAADGGCIRNGRWANLSESHAGQHAATRCL